MTLPAVNLIFEHCISQIQPQKLIRIQLENDFVVGTDGVRRSRQLIFEFKHVVQASGRLQDLEVDLLQ